MTPDDLAALLAGYHWRLGNERLLQFDVAERLWSNRIPFAREHVLGYADRVDFLVDGHIALELKIKCQRRHIYRQLERYAAHDVVDSLVLMSLTPIGMPPAIRGKPIYVVKLGLSGL